MERLMDVSRLLNDPGNLKRIEEIRAKYPDDQVEFITAMTPFFSHCLGKIPTQHRKIITLFADHGTELPTQAIARYSHQQEHLPQLEKAGILEKTENGDWRLKNHDLLCYIIVKFSGFISWMKKKGKSSSGDIVDKYIANVNKQMAPQLDAFR